MERSDNVVLGREVREATTGRVVAVLPRVWATVQSGVEQAQEGRTLRQRCAGRQNGLRAEVRATEREAVQSRVRVRPELAFYRKYTEGMLRRYVQMSMEAGRVPSMLGREMFRGKVTSYRVRSFEDVVIFRLDVERCLKKLDGEEQQLVKRIALQEYTQGEAAMLLGMSLRGCVRRYGEAIDRLTGLFLEYRLLEPLQGLSSAEDAA